MFLSDNLASQLTFLIKKITDFVSTSQKSRKNCVCRAAQTSHGSRKDEALSECWFNVGPLSETLAQPWTTIGWTSRIFWGCAWYARGMSFYLIYQILVSVKSDCYTHLRPSVRFVQFLFRRLLLSLHRPFGTEHSWVSRPLWSPNGRRELPIRRRLKSTVFVFNYVTH